MFLRYTVHGSDTILRCETGYLQSLRRHTKFCASFFVIGMQDKSICPLYQRSCVTSNLNRSGSAMILGRFYVTLSPRVTQSLSVLVLSESASNNLNVVKKGHIM